MANSVSHAALPYPIKNARYTVQIPYLDADGDPTDPTTPDTEISGDGGAYADCAEEVTTISGSNGSGYITLSGAETNYSMLMLAAKVASGPKATLATLNPRVLPIVESDTAQAGASGTITLASGATAMDITGCFVRTTGGTGGGGTGGANNQARKITAYNTSTKVATVVPNWETTPDNTTTYDILLPEGQTLAMLKALNPTVPGRTADVSTGGEVGLDWANVGTPGSTVNLSGTTVKTATDVETDTADIQSRIGTPSNLGGGASLAANLADIESQTDDIGTAGAGLTDLGGMSTTMKAQVEAEVDDALGSGTGTALTNIPWNANWDAEVQSEATDALNAYDPPTRAELTSDVNSILAVLQGLVLETGTIGATGNSTTALHLEGLTYGDDEINNHLLVIFDVSEGEYHARWITDWANTGDLATVATLPFTPQNSTDTYWLLPIRQDVTGGSGLDAAGVRAAIGLASANLDNQLDAIPTAAENRAEMDSNSTKLASILEDTGTTLDDLIDDLESRLGTPSNLGSGATISANLVDIESQTDDIGTAGAGLTDLGGMSTTMKAQVEAEVDDALGSGTGTALTNIPWNANWDTEVQSEVQDAIEANNLDHLVGTATGIPSVPAGTFIDQIMDDGTAVYDRTTDSLQAIRDRGDAAWDTADVSGLALESTAQSILADTGTDGVVVATASKTGYALSAAGIQAIWDALTSALTTANSIGKLIVDNVNATISSRSSHSAADVWASATRTLTAFAHSVTVGTNNDKTGYRLSSTGVDDILDEAISEPTSPFTWASATLRNIMGWLGAVTKNPRRTTSSQDVVRNEADNAAIGTAPVSDDLTTLDRGGYS